MFREDCDIRRWKEALKEINENEFIHTEIDSRKGGNSIRTTLGKWLYSVVRVTNPNVVVETGVSWGISSFVILSALEKNQNGRLYSIDLPNLDTNSNYNVGESSLTGIVVPKQLRVRWKLELGDSSVVLPRLLKRLSIVDIFFHDSDHSYEFMRKEFSLVYPFLKNGGILIADDIQKSLAFNEFVSSHHMRWFKFRKGGTARKIFIEKLV